MTEKKSRAEDMRKSRANVKLIQVRLTPENEKILNEKIAETGETTTELVNRIINESKTKT